MSTLQLQELYINNDEYGENFDKYKKCMKIIKMNSYRLLRLVNNLIDISKIDAGFIKTRFGNYSIDRLIEDIVLSIENYANDKSLSLEFNSNIDNVVIACDPDKIERIMLNLLSNAIKFTNSGGRIIVSIDKDDNNVIISVEDTGIGIPKEKLHNIFTRFVQVDKSLSRTQEGSGIGLSLVKAFVEIHGGDIFVESKLDKGSKFTVTLPIRTIDEDECNIDESEPRWTMKVERLNVEFSDIYSAS